MSANTSRLFFDVFARDRTRDTFSKIGRSTDTLSGKIARFSKLAAGVGATAFVAFAAQGVRSFMDFDAAMTESLAIMGEVSGPMRKQMEDAAREIGRTTRFGANEAAQGYFFLASAGMDAEQSIAALPQVAKFAQAGMFDLARATDLATDAQSALGMASKDPEQNLRNLTRVTDTLVGANTLANASVEQFSSALTGKAGPAMRQVNMEIEEGLAVLAVWADAGVKGETASTRFAATLEGLQRNAINNRDAFAEMNIAVFDGEGNMRNMADIVGDLEASLGHMSVEQQKTALMQLGFNRQALDGVVSLMGLSDQIRIYEGDLQGMAGITDEVANKQLESFAAKLDLMRSRISDWGMSVGEVLVNTTFTVGETVGEMSRMFSENLPEGVQIGMLAVAGVTAAAPLVIGAWRKIKSAVETARISYLLMGTTAKVATLSLGAVGIAAVAGGGILAWFARRNLEAKQRVDELRDSLDRQTGAVTDLTRETAAKELQDRGALDAADKLGLSLDTVTAAALGNTDAIAEVERATKDASDAYTDAIVSGDGVANSVTEQKVAAENLTSAMEDSNEVLTQAQREQRQLAEATGEGEDAQDDLTDAVYEANDAIDEQVDALDELIKQLDDMVKAAFDARGATRDWEAALDDARDALKENGATLDITTEKGRDNERQLDRLARAALDDAAATLEDAEAKGELARGHADATDKMVIARAEFVKIAQEMSLSRQEAEQLADELGLIPGNYTASIIVEGADTGIKVLDSFTAAADRAARNRNMRLNATVVGGQAMDSWARQLPGRSRGGPVGPGWFGLVGEDGPEFLSVSPGVHARVTDAPSTRQAIATGPSDTGAPPRGVVVENLNVQAWTDRFSLPQIEAELAMHGAV